MKALTINDAQPIIDTLKRAGYLPKLVGSVAENGKSDHDIDICLPVTLEYDLTPTIYYGMIIRDSDSLCKYYDSMFGLGYKCVVAPPFSEVDVWLKDNIKIDIFLMPIPK